MNLMQKVFAIVNKETKEIVQFGFTAKAVYEEWENFFLGTDDETTHELTETFMSRDEIKSQYSVN